MLFWQTTIDPGIDGILDTADDVVTTVATTFLADIMSVVTDILAIFSTEPVVYFVMLALVGASVGIVKRLIPSKSH